jgi:hypothetical protein
MIGQNKVLVYDVINKKEAKYLDDAKKLKDFICNLFIKQLDSFYFSKLEISFEKINIVSPDFLKESIEDLNKNIKITNLEKNKIKD